jgi:hypothetical protein
MRLSEAPEVGQDGGVALGGGVAFEKGPGGVLGGRGGREKPSNLTPAAVMNLY